MPESSIGNSVRFRTELVCARPNERMQSSFGRRRGLSSAIDHPIAIPDLYAGVAARAQQGICPCLRQGVSAARDHVGRGDVIGRVQIVAAIVGHGGTVRPGGCFAATDLRDCKRPRSSATGAPADRACPREARRQNEEQWRPDRSRSKIERARRAPAGHRPRAPLCRRRACSPGWRSRRPRPRPAPAPSTRHVRLPPEQREARAGRGGITTNLKLG
jgi:hypothetical protein